MLLFLLFSSFVIWLWLNSSAVLWFQEQRQIFGLALPSNFGKKQGESELKIKIPIQPHFHLCFQKETVLCRIDNAKYNKRVKQCYAFEEWETFNHIENSRLKFLLL